MSTGPNPAAQDATAGSTHGSLGEQLASIIDNLPEDKLTLASCLRCLVMKACCC